MANSINFLIEGLHCLHADFLGIFINNRFDLFSDFPHFLGRDMVDGHLSFKEIQRGIHLRTVDLSLVSPEPSFSAVMMMSFSWLESFFQVSLLTKTVCGE